MSKEARDLIKWASRLAFALVLIWFLLWHWNPFGLSGGQRWFDAYLLYLLYSIQWYSYDALAEIKKKR